MKYIIDLPEEVVEKANPFEGEIGSALHDAIYLDSFIKGIKGEIKGLSLIGYAYVDGKREIAKKAVFDLLDKHMGKENG